MKLNQRKSAHVIANHKNIAVEYSFTKDDVSGQEPGSRKVWAIIKFSHPDTKHQVRLRVCEHQRILEANDPEIHAFLEREVECYFKHCEDENGEDRKELALKN